MEDIKELSKEEFMWVLILLSLFHSKESDEILRKYIEKEKPTEV